MKRTGKNYLIFLFILNSSFSFAQQKKDSTVMRNKKMIRWYGFMPYVDAALKQKVDSTYFSKSNFVAKKYPVFKRSAVAKVSGFSSASEKQLLAAGVPNKENHLFLLTDSLAIVNTEQCPFNKADLPPNEIDSLFAIFSNKAHFDKIQGGGSNCFFPRHTFLFYDKSNKVIGYIEICFQCDMVLASRNLNKKLEGNFKGDGEAKLKALCKRNDLFVAD